MAENSEGAESSPSEAAREVESPGLGLLRLGVVAADRVAHVGDRTLTEELLLAGDQGDPAQDVGSART